MIMDNRNKTIHGMTDVDNKTHESNLVPGNESEVVDLKGLEMMRLDSREAQNHMNSIPAEVFGSDVK